MHDNEKSLITLYHLYVPELNTRDSGLGNLNLLLGPSFLFTILLNDLPGLLHTEYVNFLESERRFDEGSEHLERVEFVEGKSSVKGRRT